MTDLRDPQPAAPALADDDLRELIAEALLGGAEPLRLAELLAEREGLPLPIAAREVQAAIDNPYLRAALPLRDRLTKWGWVLQNGARLARLDPRALRVPVLDRPSGERLLHDHYLAQRPAVVRGLIDSWPARAWTLDRVADRLGDTPVRVQWSRDSDAAYEVNSHALAADRPFSEIAARLRAPAASNDFYVTANNADANRAAFAPLFADVGEIPGILAPGGAKAGFLWIGPKGTVTPWHHDLTNNLLLQIVGRKRVKLVAAHDTPLMRNDRHCFSGWSDDDLPPGPATGEKPAVLEATIGPGDALFIPVGWWHHVEGLDQTIGMSFTRFAWDNDFYSSYTTYGPL